MAENENRDSKNITAKDLLNRLSKSKGETAGATPRTTYSDYVEKHAEEIHSNEAADDSAEAKQSEAESAAPDLAASADTEYSAADTDYAADGNSFGAQAENAPLGETADAPDAENAQYDTADNPDYADYGTDGAAEDYTDADPVYDDYGDSAYDMMPDETSGDFSADDADYTLLSDTPDADYVPVDDGAGDEIYPDDEYYPEDYPEDGGEYDESYADAPYGDYTEDAAYGADGYSQHYDGTAPDAATAADLPPAEDYGDIIPDDDFFDNDPIEESEPEEAAPEESEPEEYDEKKDFENLVAEVTGDGSDELDEKDISLMVALGMEDELAKSVGSETAAQMTDDYVADQEEWVDRTHRFGAGEYSDPSENGAIAEKYRKRNRFAIIKMIICFAAALVLLIFENLPVLGYQPSGALDPMYYPVVYLMFDLQFVTLGAALMIKHIGRGLSSLIRFKPTVDSIPAFMAIASVAVTIITAYTAVPGVEPKVFNFPTALCFFFAAVGEYLTVRREIFSFNVVSSKKPKYVMRRLSTRDSVLENEAAADFDSPVADEGDVIKIQKTDFVDGYFWRTNNHGTQGRSYIGFAIAVSVVLAVVIGIYAGVTKSASPVSTAFAALSAAMPASMVILGCYPFYRANRQAYESDSTIIGEGSVEEYSGIGVISFDDVNVFPSNSVKVRNVRLFNNCRIDKVLYYAASVFSATGGPLADVFDVATMETGHSENVEILETGAGYIEAQVNGRSIMFGSAAALSALGIIIPEDIVDDGTQLPVDCTVMYMIYQRKLVARMIVNYVIDPDFEYILKQLTGSGMCVCVKTFDPNIDEDMIYRQIKSGKYSLRVIKYKNTEEITKYSRRAEGGIVSRGNTKSLLHTVSSCDKILSAQKTGFVMGIISAILSAVIMGVVLIAGSFGSMHSIYIALCQLFWLIPVIISTKLIVR